MVLGVLIGRRALAAVQTRLHRLCRAGIAQKKEQMFPLMRLTPTILLQVAEPFPPLTCMGKATWELFG